MFCIIFIFVLKVTVISCASLCENFATCSACIQTTLDKCVWCSADHHQGKRCQSEYYHLINKDWCKTELYAPKFEKHLVKNETFSTGENGGKIVQVFPQYVKIKSSPGVLINVTMTYKPAKDAPLEVYYLLDNSRSMEVYKQRLAKQALTIYKSLKKVTNNVRIGFGSYVEKPALPFANPNVHNAYSFKNHLSLTDDMETLSQALNQLKQGQNYDLPEALLDGLMQAMLCKTEVDWKSDSRRIIVVFTDGEFHIAGDGKFVGALKPNQMECYKNVTMHMVQDYPSISQINKVAMDNGYAIIFAITDHVKEVYKLSDVINGAISVSLEKEQDIAKMITSEYLRMIKRFEITNNASSYIDITTKRNCTDCKLMHYQPLTLVTTFKVTSCPPPPKTNEYVKFVPTSLKEAIIVEIEFDCECGCEKNINTEFNSSKCTGAGNYQCGICKCNQLRSGDKCQCFGDSWDTKDYDKCKKDVNDTLYCSGRGECRCGKCDPCHKGYSGPYCEFNDNACPRRGGLLCSGNGNCTMGSCNCYPKWSSLPERPLDCSCSTEQRTCIAPYSTKVCSGNGDCVCGKCVCDRMENANDTCRGRYCDNCKEFAQKRCEELQDYAYCIFLNKTKCNEAFNQTDTEVEFANKTEINSPNRTDWFMANWCRVRKGEDDKIFVFKYYYRAVTEEEENDNQVLVLVIQTELEMPPPADIWVPVGSALGGILLIGLLTLILWKVLSDLYYEREYNKFEKKAKEAGYDVTLNPWYEPPVVSFINPAHRAD